jgi:hypothetical protein
VRKLALRPETLRQARLSDAAASFYRRAGLCDRCAGQAAWGHATSFSEVLPPCQECHPLVQSFPNAASGTWRCFVQTRRTNAYLMNVLSSGGPGSLKAPENVITGTPLRVYGCAA